MGIKNLWAYLHDHKDRVFRDIDLAAEARHKGATAERRSRAELWCDYGAVVRKLETALLKEKHPKYCSYYGCDTRLLGQQMGALIEGLRSIHIEPVFVSDAPLGADAEGFRAKYDEIKSRQGQRRDRSRQWEYKVKFPQHRQSWPDNMPNVQCYVVCDEVLREHKVRNLVTNCEADTVLIHRCKTSPNALGILSVDTDFAVAEHNSVFLPLDYFDCNAVMGFHKGAINQTIHSLPCRYTNRQLVAKSLSLQVEDMTMFAILCGNDYTNQYVYNIKHQLGIEREKRKDPREVASWLRENRSDLGKIERQKQKNKGFQDACKYSTDLYSGTEPRVDPCDVSEQGTLSPIFLSIKKGIFLQTTVALVQSVGGPLPYKVSQSIRETIYALCGQTKITEYGFCTFKADDFGVISVRSKEDLSDVQRILKRCPFSTRAAALHHLISTPLYHLAERGHVVLKEDPPADLPPDEQEVLRGIIAISSLVHFFAQVGLEDENIRVQQVRACLLAFAATSAGIQGHNLNIAIGAPDPHHFLRAVSLSSTISVSLLALYNVAELIDLVPKASDIFCSSVFVPVYMAVMRHLPRGIPALDPVVSAGGSPHLAELMGCIRTMEHTHGMPELTSPRILTGAVHSYTALVGEVKQRGVLLKRQKQQQPRVRRSISCEHDGLHNCKTPAGRGQPSLNRFCSVPTS